MCKKFASAVTGGILATVFSLDAQAFPVSPSQLANAAPVVTPVAGGCGIGWHRGPFGGCRPNAGPAVVAPAAPVVVAPVVVAPAAPAVVARVCPPGYHIGPAGRACRPNY